MEKVEIQKRLELLIEKDQSEELHELLLNKDKVGKDVLDAALHLAASLGHPTSCRQLIQACADVNGREKVDRHEQRHRGVSAAFSREHGVQQAWLRGHTAVGGTPLHRAAEAGHLDCVTVLLQNGSEVNAADGRGITPLMLACMRRGTEQLVRVLTFMPGCDVNKRDARMPGRTAMHFAAYAGDPDVIAQLIKTGADIDVNDEIHNTPLHLACSACPFTFHTWPERQELACVALLLEQGCFVNLFNIEGETPLHKAVEQGDADLVDLLLEHNALVHPEILRIAVLTYKSPVIAESLLEHCSRYDETLLVAMLITIICSEKSQWLLNREGLEYIDHELVKLILKSLTNTDLGLCELLLKDAFELKSVFGLEHFEKITPLVIEDLMEVGLLGLALKYGAYGIAHMLYMCACQPKKLPVLKQSKDIVWSKNRQGLRDWLPNVLQCPVPALKMLCRNRIRCIYKQEAFIVVPAWLQEYVEMSDLDAVSACDWSISQQREKHLDLTYSSRCSAQAKLHQMLALYTLH